MGNHQGVGVWLLSFLKGGWNDLPRWRLARKPFLIVLGSQLWDGVAEQRLLAGSPASSLEGRHGSGLVLHGGNKRVPAQLVHEVLVETSMVEVSIPATRALARE